MDNPIDVFTKLQTLGAFFVPLIAICLLGLLLLEDELGHNDIGKDLGNLWKSFKRRLNSTKIATKVSKPDEMELRVLSRLQTYFKQPGHSHTVTQHSRCIEFQNWDCDIYGDLYLITDRGRLAILAKLLNDNGFSISYQANDMCGGKCWDIWKPTGNEKPAFLNFQ